MAIYKRGRYYWYKFVWNGEAIRKSTKQGNGAVARQMEAAHRTALAKGEVGIREKKPAPTLAEFCEKRLEPWAKGRFEQTVPKSWDWYRTNIRIIQASSLSSLRLDSVTNEHAGKFAAERLAKGYAVASVNSTIRVTRRALKLAVEWGVIGTAPKLTKLPGENHREHVVTREEEEKYYSACVRDPADDEVEYERYLNLSEFMRLLFETGVRPEEAFALRWEHINWQVGGDGVIFIAGGKTAAARRYVPMSPVLKFVLGARWERLGKPSEGWQWPAETKSGHADHCTFRRRHKQVLATATIRPFLVYSARHTFLTRLGESGCDVWTLARIAGHSNISISMRYVHPSADAVKKAMENLGGHKSGHRGNLQRERTQEEVLLLTENTADSGEPGRI